MLLKTGISNIMNIERATTKVINELLGLVQRQFLEHEIGFNPDQLEAAIRRMLDHEGLGFILIAKDNDQLLGFAAISFAWTLEHGGKSAWLDELYVLPEHRNAGIGSVLIERVLTEAEKEVAWPLIWKSIMNIEEPRTCTSEKVFKSLSEVDG